MAFDVVAVTGGKPSATSTGKVTSVPDPTTVLINPAQTPASAMTPTSHHCIGPPYEPHGGRPAVASA